MTWAAPYAALQHEASPRGLTPITAAVPLRHGRKLSDDTDLLKLYLPDEGRLFLPAMPRTARLSSPLPSPFDDAADEFHIRLTRRACGRPIGARRAARTRGRSLAALAVAIAVPAFAAPQGWTDSASASGVASSPLAFETPGESFPGSAFYYLEEVPAVSSARPADLAPGAHWDDAEAAQPGPGPAASPLVARSSATDHARALECMTMAIYYEAASESDAGQRAVAQVVMNRVAHPSYPNTVCGVVFQGSARSSGCQFSFTCDGALARKPERNAWARARSVARAALQGFVYAPVGLATHYHTIQVHPYWADSLTTVGTIGAHIFYRWKGSAGKPSAFRARYAGGEPTASILAADRANSAEVADPVALARAYEQAILASSQAAQPQAGMSETHHKAEISTGSGSVKAEYADSGKWLTPRH
jgi:spore germination cell wall hydrolase CwlJ-like protein